MVTDSVNDINLVLDAFRDVAISLEILFIEIQIIFSDKGQHRHRVENRVSDIPGLTVPDREKVQSRHYERWCREHIQFDTAELTVTEYVNRILALTEQERFGNNLTIHR